ncbi:MAG: hypothetical protein ABWX57_04980 [Aeromicrobium sp.]
MHERTAASGQNVSSPANSLTTGRYSQFTAEQLDDALSWIREQGAEAWSSRFRIVGDYVLVAVRGVPSVVRHLLREEAAALQLMTPHQVRQLVTADVRGRVDLVDQVLTSAGR